MISKQETKHVAELARIGLSEEELDKFSHDLSSILDWIDQLAEVNISGIEPTKHIAGVKNISRGDKAEEFDNKNGIKKLFPEEKNGFNKVKSVL